MKTAKNKLEPIETPDRESGKTLVAYVTKGGATGDAANIIANTLRGECELQVDLVDLRKQPKPDITPFSNIVVGGVRAAKVHKEPLNFIGQDLSDKRVAFFVC